MDTFKELLNSNMPAILVLAIGFGELVVAASMAFARKYRISTWYRVNAVVAEVLKYSTRRGLRFKPVLEFRTATGERVKKPSAIASNPNPYKMGDEVEVLYSPADPGKYIISGDKRVQRLLLSMITSAIVFIVIGIAIL